LRTAQEKEKKKNKTTNRERGKEMGAFLKEDGHSTVGRMRWDGGSRKKAVVARSAA